MLVESLYDNRIQRDTGQWLPIAESAEAVNQVCVGGEGTGGMEETGELKIIDAIRRELTNVLRR